MLSYKTRMIHTVCFLPISNIKLFEFVAVVYWFVWYIVGLCACLKCGILWVCVLASSVVYRGFVCLPQLWYIVGLSSSQVKPKTMKLVFAASPLRTLRVGSNTGWLEIRIMCPSGATCLSADCCFSELEL